MILVLLASVVTLCTILPTLIMYIIKHKAIPEPIVIAERSPRERILDIEKTTHRSVEIEANEEHANGKFDPQLPDCPLFSILPRELRDVIWAYATAPYEDPEGGFEKTAYYYRPGHTARLKTDTALLRTCRRVWLEANAMPMLQAEQSFYYKRPAPDQRDPRWMAKLRSQNRENFGHLHLFVQMYLIEGLQDTRGSLRKYFLGTPSVPGDFQPRVFHVTLRHTDFWFWERDEPLRLRDSWVQAMLDSPDLRGTEIFKLELETLDYKVSQLLPILERVKRMESRLQETHLIDGNPAKTKFVLARSPEEYDWEGPTNIGKQDFGPYKGKPNLKYHVVTLTWRLTFPDIPRANVAELRRAPRFDPIEEKRREESRFRQKGCSSGNKAPEPMMQWRRLQESKNPSRQLRQWRLKESFVRRVSTENAEAVEDVRRQALNGWSASIDTEAWKAKWEAEKSLLKFGGSLSENRQ